MLPERAMVAYLTRLLLVLRDLPRALWARAEQRIDRVEYAGCVAMISLTCGRRPSRQGRGLGCCRRWR